MKILLLDNYDSFTYNLAHLIQMIVPDAILDVRKNDEIELVEIEEYDKIMLSPGPGLPQDAGLMPELLNKYAESKDIFGVCLGLQAIAIHFHAKLKNLNPVFHGLARPINIIQEDIIFKNCPINMIVGRYHSWVVDSEQLPDCLIITAIDQDQNIMALKHQSLHIRGVQFHPESIMTENGLLMIQNWLSN